MMALDFLPDHLVIVGGSYVGLEFAQMYRRFGSQVTVVEKGPRLIAREDDDVSDEIRSILEREGIAVRTGAECMALSKRGNRIVVGLQCRDGEPLAEGSHVLLAVGRAPNTHDLGLDEAGIETDARGYMVHQGRRRVPHERAGRLGARRRQRPRRVHAHFLQRLRDRRRQPV
jgi:pyruvate/2-oxoglutarate dehydrogenase complex dihydrolipoamide dehydrogenase (E3) component